MFKLFQNKNNRQQIKKKGSSQGDDCPMCRVSPEIIKSLKDNSRQAGNKKIKS